MMLWYSRAVARRGRAALLLLLAVVDLGSFGWFYEWRVSAPERTILDTPVALERYKQEALARGGRVFPFEGFLASRHSAQPNLNWAWGIPSASGNDSLVVKRYALALGWEDPASLRTENRVLDLLATRYLLIERGPIRSPGFNWSGRIDAVLGPDEGHRRYVDGNLPDVWTTQIGLVGALANSVNLADGTPVASLTVTTADGQVITRSIRAGSELSEWAYDRADVRRVIQQRQAPIFDSYPIHGGRRSTFQAHRYVAVFDLGGSYRVRGIEIEYSASAPVVIAVHKVSLRDDRTGMSAALAPGLTDTERWRYVEDFDGVAVYENRRAQPRAWMVSKVVTLTPEQILAAIQHSQMPDGTPFDAGQWGLVEEPLQLASADTHPGDVVVTTLGDARVELKTRSAAAAFLILSDVYYPGWRASIDGRQTHVYQTDYLLRGVAVPAGEHVVEFVFRPQSVYVGALISSLSVLVLVALRFV